MRNARAKWLRKLALKNPAPMRTDYFGRTLVYGGVKRQYRELKLRWGRRGIIPMSYA